MDMWYFILWVIGDVLVVGVDQDEEELVVWLMMFFVRMLPSKAIYMYSNCDILSPNGLT